MDSMEMRKMAELCTRDEPVFCANACPLKWDVRSFVAKMQAGDFAGAYVIFRNAVYFPDTVCRICDRPCEQACILDEKEAAVSLRGLERACCDYTPTKEQKSYYILKKNKTVAVIGGGLGGVACACKLAKKGYDVDVYDERPAPGGYLHDTHGPPLSGVMAEELYRVMQLCEVRYHADHQVKNIDEISADAIFISTGHGGSRFGLDQGWDAATLATTRTGVFMSGGYGADQPILAPLREGLQAADAMATFLKVGRMEGKAGVQETAPTRLCLKADGTRCGPLWPAEVSPRTTPAREGRYTAEEAVAEAGRCLLCSCDKCLSSCELLEGWNKPPKGIIDDVNMTLTSVAGLTSHLATRKISSCNLCGLCRDICPTGLDLESIFLASRRALHKKGEFPPAFHDFWLRDMKFSQSEEFFLTLPADARPAYAFFPGCQLGGSDPRYVGHGYAYLNKCLAGGVGLILSCCGAPAHWAGREEEQQQVSAQIRRGWQQLGQPMMITACPTCEKVLRESLPEIPLLSMYSVIAEHGLEKRPASAERRQVAVFDPCASRATPQTQAAVRKILAQADLPAAELPFGQSEARCCGYGGHIHAANGELMEEIVSRRIGASPLDYVVYCINCREIFARAGKRAMHLLDLLLPDAIEGRMSRGAVSLSESRDNRRATRREMMKQYGASITATAAEESDMELIFTPETMRKMDRELITSDDVAEVVRYCEETDRKMLDIDSGYLVGNKKIGEITYWAVYSPEGDAYKIISVYSHRMGIGEKK